MTIPELECVVCSSVLDNPTAKLSPTVCTILAFSDYWESPEAIQVARGIRKAIERGRPTHRVVVGLLMDQEYRDWLKHPMFNEGLPLSCLDSAVAPLLKHYDNKRIVACVTNTYDLLMNDTTKAKELAGRLVQQLQEAL